jgi:hypothetical protein
VSLFEAGNRYAEQFDQIVPSYEVLETGLTMVRMGRLRIISMHGMTDFTSSTYTLPAGDAPQQHITASCWVCNSSYNKIRIGRIYVEDGKLYARQVDVYGDANKGMAALLTGDRVYGEIVYTT